MSDSGIPPLFRPASENLFRPAGTGGQGLQFADIQQDPAVSGDTMAEELANNFEGPTFLTSTNVVFSCYAFYASLLVLKMIILAFMTVVTRAKKKSKENRTNVIDVVPNTKLTHVASKDDTNTIDVQDLETTAHESSKSVETENPNKSKGHLARDIGQHVTKGLQVAAMDLKHKGVSYLKDTLPNDLKKLPAHLKTANVAKYVRKRVTLKKLVYLGFELLTARIYYKVGMGVMYGLFNLAWKHYVSKPNRDEVRTQDRGVEGGTQVFVSPEDTNLNGGVVSFDDPDIERLRRAHLNDLENIPTFLVIALLYVMTDPGTMLACWLIRTFTLVRFLHTIVYGIYVLPQPSRAVCFIIGVLIQIYMLVIVMMTYHYY